MPNIMFTTDDGREYPARMAGEIAAEWPPIEQELIAASATADDDPERFFAAVLAAMRLLVPDLPVTDPGDLSRDDIDRFVQFTREWAAQQPIKPLPLTPSA